MSDKYIYQQDGTIREIAKPNRSTDSIGRYIVPLKVFNASTLQGYKEGDVLVENVDFYLQHQLLGGDVYSGNGVWIDCTKDYFDSFIVQQKRIIALPLKKEENITEKDWDDIQELRTKEKNERDAELKSLHGENERYREAVDGIMEIISRDEGKPTDATMIAHTKMGKLNEIFLIAKALNQ